MISVKQRVTSAPGTWRTKWCAYIAVNFLLPIFEPRQQAPLRWSVRVNPRAISVVLLSGFRLFGISLPQHTFASAVHLEKWTFRLYRTVQTSRLHSPPQHSSLPM